MGKLPIPGIATVTTGQPTGNLFWNLKPDVDGRNPVTRALSI